MKHTPGPRPVIWRNHYSFFLNSTFGFSGYKPGDTLELAWSGQYPISVRMNTDAVLQKLFVLFNTAHPEGYMLRSMSIGDVVWIADHFYTLCNGGWVRVPKDPYLKSLTPPEATNRIIAGPV